MRQTASVRNEKWFQAVIMLALLTMFTLPVMAAPENITSSSIVNTTRMDIGPVTQETSTLGGAETQVDLTLWTQTLFWQAYYGTIESEFRLMDGTDIFYDWDNPTPEGEIFASRDLSIDWSLIACSDLTTMQAEESITGTGADSVSSTFASSNVNSFSVAGVDIAAGECDYATYTINSTGQQGTFEEILLESQNSMIYTSIVSADGSAFTGEAVDFQMLVAEDGLDDASTTYYFYTELN